MEDLGGVYSVDWRIVEVFLVSFLFFGWWLVVVLGGGMRIGVMLTLMAMEKSVGAETKVLGGLMEKWEEDVGR